MAEKNLAHQYFHPGCMETLPFIGKRKISDEMFDEFKTKLLNNLVENTAPGKLDVHTSDLIMKSILITGPRIVKKGGASMLHHLGKDNIETMYEDEEGKIQKLESADCFRVRTSGGTAVEVILSSPKLLEIWGGGVIPTEYIEDAISKIRKVLREKKA